MRASFWTPLTIFSLILVLLLPLSDLVLPQAFLIADKMRTIFIFAILGMGLGVLTGYTGLLNLGVAAFMAIGAYTYAILTCDIYPFQVGFWIGILCASLAGGVVGALLGLPTLRLRGDYLAIVTLGFGEMMQDTLRNLEVITKGTQGINPLPSPTLFGYGFNSAYYYPWYYLFLAILAVVTWLTYNLQHSRLGRTFRAIKEDELAGRCMGVKPLRTKVIAFSLCEALCGLAGALWASFLGSSGEPSNYDFQISILALCIIIVGGMGSIKGVLLGAVIMVGFNSVLLVKLSEFFIAQGLVSTQNVYLAPNNWKYMVFGFALIIMMRLRPDGLLPSSKERTR